MPFAWIVIVILWWCVSAIMRSRKEAEAKPPCKNPNARPRKTSLPIPSLLPRPSPPP